MVLKSIKEAGKCTTYFLKNITSRNKGQRVLSSLELSEQSGIRSQVHRHLVCRITEASGTETVLPKPTLYVLKKQDMKERLELFIAG